MQWHLIITNITHVSQHAALSQPKRTFVLKPSSCTPTKLSFVSHSNHMGLWLYGWDVMCRPRPLDRGGRNPQLTGHQLCNGLRHHCSLVEHPSTLRSQKTFSWLSSVTHPLKKRGFVWKKELTMHLNASKYTLYTYICICTYTVRACTVKVFIYNIR